MPYLIDTDVAIHLRDGDPATNELTWTLAERPFLSVVTIVELEGGVYANPAFSAKRREALDVMLSDFPILDLSREIASSYGNIVRRIGFSRRKISDRMIAATALVHELTLVTFNGRDFRDVPTLELLEWVRPESLSTSKPYD